MILTTLFSYRWKKHSCFLVNYPKLSNVEPKPIFLRWNDVKNAEWGRRIKTPSHNCISPSLIRCFRLENTFGITFSILFSQSSCPYRLCFHKISRVSGFSCVRDIIAGGSSRSMAPSYFLSLVLSFSAALVEEIGDGQRDGRTGTIWELNRPDEPGRLSINIWRRAHSFRRVWNSLSVIGLCAKEGAKTAAFIFFPL